jgi:hypothetical protein
MRMESKNAMEQPSETYGSRNYFGKALQAIGRD